MSDSTIEKELAEAKLLEILIASKHECTVGSGAISIEAMRLELDIIYQN